jgi:hypothetical protein
LSALEEPAAGGAGVSSGCHADEGLFNAAAGAAAFMAPDDDVGAAA